MMSLWRHKRHKVKSETMCFDTKNSAFVALVDFALELKAWSLWLNRTIMNVYFWKGHSKNAAFEANFILDSRLFGG